MSKISKPLLLPLSSQKPHFPTLPTQAPHFPRFFSSSSPFIFFSPPPPPASSLLETLTPKTLARSSLEWVPRTDLCGELGLAYVGCRVRLCGWVVFHCVHGGLTFINLGDYSGLVQVMTHPEAFLEAYVTANRVRLEYVVAVEGTVRARPGESLNKKMKIGDIEELIEKLSKGELPKNEYQCMKPSYFQRYLTKCFSSNEPCSQYCPLYEIKKGPYLG